MTEPNPMVVVFDPNTGLIRQTIDHPWPPETPEFFDGLKATMDDLDWLIVDAQSLVNKCVIDGEIADRPVQNLTYATTHVLGTPYAVTGVKAGTFFVLDGQRFDVAAGTVPINFETVGTYSIHSICFPHMDERWEVEVTA